MAMLAEAFRSSASALALSSAMLCLLPSMGAPGHARLAPLASDPSLGSEASASSGVSSYVLPDPARHRVCVQSLPSAYPRVRSSLQGVHSALCLMWPCGSA